MKYSGLLSKLAGALAKAESVTHDSHSARTKKGLHAYYARGAKCTSERKREMHPLLYIFRSSGGGGDGQSFSHIWLCALLFLFRSLSLYAASLLIEAV